MVKYWPERKKCYCDLHVYTFNYKGHLKTTFIISLFVYICSQLSRISYVKHQVLTLLSIMRVLHTFPFDIIWILEYDWETVHIWYHWRCHIGYFFACNSGKMIWWTGANKLAALVILCLVETDQIPEKNPILDMSSWSKLFYWKNHIIQVHRRFFAKSNKFLSWSNTWLMPWNLQTWLRNTLWSVTDWSDTIQITTR